jgi:hypothetical protein
MNPHFYPKRTVFTVILAALILTSCSKKEVTGTIEQYGCSYSLHKSLQGPFKVREYLLLKLKEYPGRTFEAYMLPAKDTQMFKAIEDAEKNGKIPFDQIVYYETPTNVIKVLLSRGPVESRWNVGGIAYEPPKTTPLANDHSITNNTQALKSYLDESRGFEFKYPTNWQVLDAAQLAAKSAGMITAGSGGDIVLTVGNPEDWDQNLILKMPGRMDSDLTKEQLDNFAEQLDKSGPSNFENFKKISQNMIKVSGADALEFNTQSTQRGELFQQKEVIFTKNKVAFVIICTGKQNLFEKLDNEYFQVILQTFKAN